MLSGRQLCELMEWVKRKRVKSEGLRARRGDRFFTSDVRQWSRFPIAHLGNGALKIGASFPGRHVPDITKTRRIGAPFLAMLVKTQPQAGHFSLLAARHMHILLCGDDSYRVGMVA